MLGWRGPGPEIRQTWVGSSPHLELCTGGKSGSPGASRALSDTWAAQGGTRVTGLWGGSMRSHAVQVLSSHCSRHQRCSHLPDPSSRRHQGQARGTPQGVLAPRGHPLVTTPSLLSASHPLDYERSREGLEKIRSF